ncbi:MAG: ABC transporter ATP-binding protein [Candidatus Bathyarchaeia archaeon]
MEDPLLSVKNLSVNFYSYRGVVHALNGAYLDAYKGETVGLVGETGCGKSTLALSVVRLIPVPGKIVSGEISFDGEDLLRKDSREMVNIRRKKISYIFQDPTAALDPVFRVGDQVAEAIMFSQEDKKEKEAKEEAVEMLALVNIPDPEKVARQFPHELSGGMRQRAMIAIALSKKPKLMMADEPTSNLDVTIQAQILDLMMELRNRTGMSVIIITHDMGIVAQTCDRVAIMYAGRIVEFGPILDVFEDPLHPYSRGLLKTADFGEEKTSKLSTIPGSVPDLVVLPSGCIFRPRCSQKQELCMRNPPGIVEASHNHFAACHLVSKME